MIISQTKEERDNKTAKVYLGNVQVVWTNGDNVSVAPRDDAPKATQQKQEDKVQVGEDLPF